MFEEYTKEILMGIGILIIGILITEYGIWRGKIVISKTIKELFPEFREE